MFKSPQTKILWSLSSLKNQVHLHLQEYYLSLIFKFQLLNYYILLKVFINLLFNDFKFSLLIIIYLRNKKEYHLRKRIKI